MKRRTASRGSTLLECAAALSVIAIGVAGSARVSEATATLIRHTRAASDAVDVARSLLEHEIGAPCAPPFECPDGYRCAVRRAPVTIAADRVSASVERVDGAAREELDTLAPAPACGS
jgi:hypothetical protein